MMEQLASTAMAHFNIPIAFRLEGALDPDALERAVNDLVGRHDTLRTVFEETEGQVAKRVLPRAALRLARHAVAAGPERDRDIAMLIRAEADAPIDPHIAPMLRAGLIALSGREYVFLFTIHHAIFDQWSSGVLFRELSALYDAQAYGRPIDVEAEPTQHATCVRQQREWLGGADHQRQLEYWKDQLRGPLAVTEMPRPRLRTATADTGATHWFDLPVSLGDQVMTTARVQRVTPFMLLLTAFMILVHRYTGAEDICVASALARRRRLEWESVIGLLMNGVMFRAQVRGQDRCDAVLRRVRDVTLGAYDNQDVPYGEVRRVVSAPNTPEQRQRQVFFHCAPRVRPEFAGVEATILPTATSSVKHDFGLSLQDEWRNGQVRWYGEAEYNASLFAPSDVVRIVGHFQDVLARVCRNPELSVADVTAWIPLSGT